MAVKLFVSDIDGTLLVSGKNISQKNIDAVKKMVDAGITVTLGTGRMYHAALPIAQALGVNVPLITYNGALIKSTDGKIFYENPLPPEIVVGITNFFEKNNWYVQNYSDDKLHFPVYNDYAKYYENNQKVRGEVIGWEGLEETEKISAAVIKEFGDKVSITRSTEIFNEIVCPGVSKAAAIKILAEKIGVKISEVMAIGDSNNDLPMLKAAGKSIAMGNANAEVKSVCDFQTGNCEDDGFAEAVYKYVLN